MAQQLTIKQIADLAGVSTGTVDRVLHNRGRVSPKSLAAVQSVLNARNYKYNLHSSAIAFKKTGKVYRIVVAIPFSNKGEYWDLIRQGIDQAFAEYCDFSISVEYACFDQFNSISCHEVFSSVIEKNCSAVIIGTTFVEETRDLCFKLDRKGIPYVFVDGKVAGTKPIAAYMADQVACGRLLARLMKGLTAPGSEIALLTPRRIGTTMSNNSAIRIDAFRNYFKESGMDNVLKEEQFPVDGEGSLNRELSAFLKHNPKVRGIAVVISTGYLIADSLSSLGIGALCVGGFDITEGNARCIREGSLDFVINQHPKQQGFHAVESTLHYLLYGVTDNKVGEYIPVDISFKENLPDA